MSLTKVTDASVEPFDVAAAKAHLRETLVDADNDAYIEALITVVRQAAEDRLERTLLETTWLLTLDEFPGRSGVLVLERPPILSVAWIKYVDTAGDLQTLDPASYDVDLVREPGRVAPAWGYFWPLARPKLGAVTLQFTAGYETPQAIPQPIVHWMKLALTDLYDRRGLSAERPAVPQDFAQQLLTMGNTVWSV